MLGLTAGPELRNSCCISLHSGVLTQGSCVVHVGTCPRGACACAGVPLYSLGSRGHMPCSLGALGIQGDPRILLPFQGILFGALALLSGLTLDWTYGKRGGHLTPSLLWTPPCLVLLGGECSSSVMGRGHCLGAGPWDPGLWDPGLAVSLTQSYPRASTCPLQNRGVFAGGLGQSPGSWGQAKIQCHKE